MGSPHTPYLKLSTNIPAVTSLCPRPHLNHELLDSTTSICVATAADTKSDASSVQSLSCVRLFAIPWTAAHHTSLSITNSRSLLKLMSIKSVMPSNHLILLYKVDTQQMCEESVEGGRDRTITHPHQIPPTDTVLRVTSPFSPRFLPTVVYDKAHLLHLIYPLFCFV